MRSNKHKPKPKNQTAAMLNTGTAVYATDCIQ